MYSIEMRRCAMINKEKAVTDKIIQSIIEEQDD